MPEVREFTSAMGLFDSGCQYRIPLSLVDVSGDGTSLVLPPVAINSTSRADVQERKSAVVLGDGSVLAGPGKTRHVL